MLKKEVNNHQFKFFDSVEIMPITRYHNLNLNLLLEAGIGSGIHSVQNHLDLMIKYLDAKKIDLFYQQFENYGQCLRFNALKISPMLNAFCCILHSIDRKEYNDITQAGFMDTKKKLTEVGISVMTMKEILNEVKKNLDAELETFFPSLIRKGKEMSYWQAIKNKMIFMAQSIKGEDVENKIETIDNYLMSAFPPQKFSGNQGLEVAQKKDFENACMLISQHMSVDPDSLTIFKFYQRLEQLKKQFKEAKDAKRN